MKPMKKSVCLLFLLLTILIPVLLGMASPAKMTDARVKKTVIQVEANPSLEIHEGYVSKKAETILVKKGRKTIARVHLSEPVMVAMAVQDEEWGFFQFPSIGKSDDGTLIVSWQMKEDSHKTYGVKSNRRYIPMMSKDKGKTWHPQDKEYDLHKMGYNVTMRDGSFLSVITPKSENIRKYKIFPNAIAKNNHYTYYLEESLPENLRGAYFNYKQAGGKTKVIHAQLDDPGLLRYAQDELMPVLWWGNIKQLSDNSLIAGVYPCDYVYNKEVVTGGVSFYRSLDRGQSWRIIGKILPDSSSLLYKQKGDESGFTEPAFEILSDSTMICVMRTGMTAPMYKTISHDKGISWEKCEPFTPNGVMPRLLLLKNGVLVLASGRPGIQLRFSVDGTGRTWTEPIDFIHFMNENGTFTRDVSCGYASILEANENSFIIVYSDFTTNNDLNQKRKSIWFRTITVNKLR